MRLTPKLILLIFAFVVGLILSLCLVSYLKGRRVGVATTKMVDVTKELDNLDKEKHEIRKNVHALDTNALRTRILELSERLTQESQAANPR